MKKNRSSSPLTRGSRLLSIAGASGLALVSAFLLIALLDGPVPAAQAARLTVTATCPTIPGQLTPWSSSCSVPKFDATLGTLAGVQFTITVSITGSAFGENLTAFPTTFSGNVTGTVQVKDPAAPAATLGSGAAGFSYSDSLGAFDGIIDNGGTSGVTHNFAVTQTSSFTVATGLATYIGSGNVTFPISGTSSFICNFVPAGSSACGSVIYSGAAMTITYLYDTPDISVTKTHTGNFVVGANGQYILTISNVGTGPTIGPITATDTLPTGLSYITATAPGWTVPLAGAGPVLTFTRASVLNAGASSLITITVGVTNTAIGVVTNTVSVTTTRDLSPTNNSTSDPTTVLPASDLSVTKSDSPDPVNALGALTYTLAVNNLGLSIAPSVQVTDVLPTGVTFIGASGTGWTITQAGQTVTATRTNLAVGAAPNIIISTTAPANGGVITNTAVITTSGSAVDSAAGNNTSTITTTVTSFSEVSITKSDSPDPVNAGATLTYTLSITNSGPSIAPSVTVTDVLPASVTYNGSTGTGWTITQAGQTVTATRTNLAVGAAPNILITVTAPATGPITNTASITTTAVDTNTANNVASASTNVNPVANLSITKGDNPDPVVTGNTLTYTLNVSNVGPNTATSLTVTDTLPASVTFLTVSAPGWNSCGQAGVIVTCTLSSLALTSAPPITITVTAPGASGVITNTATVASAITDLTASNNTATITTTVANSLADLTISKIDDPDPVDALGALTYTLSASNNGPNTASAITVTDNLPAGVAFVSASGTGWIITQSGSTVTATRASLSVGAAPDITINVTAPANGGVITNTATVASTITDPTPGNNSASVTTTVTAFSDLGITKSDGPDPVNAGATLVYTLSVSNAGPSTAPAITVTDALPSGVTFGSASGTGWAITQAGGIVTATRTNLATGAAPNIVITITAPATGGVITNSASISTSAMDTNVSNNSATASTSVTPNANLAITKSDAPDPVMAVATLTYTLRITNTGPSAAPNIIVTDTLPTGTTFFGVSAPGWDSCGQSGLTVTCTLSTLSVTAAPLITITVSTPASGPITNTAVVASDIADLTPANNTATASTTITPISDLAITKTDSPDPVTVGQTLTYTLNVTNTGPSVASTVRVTDTLPASVTFGGVSGPGWTSCGRTGVTVTCTVTSLAVGPAPAIIITVTAPATPGLITNTVVVTATTLDSNAANNSASASTTVNPLVDLVITKDDGQTTAVPGTLVNYTLIVTNTSTIAVTGATVTDNFPATLSGVTWSCSATGGSSCGSASGNGNIAATVNLAASGRATFTASGTLASTATGTLSNTATVTAPSGINDPNLSNNSATDSDTLTPQGDLSISKTDGQTTAVAGGVLTYTIIASNAGPSAITSATLTDTFPASISGVTWTCSASSGSSCPASGSGNISAAVDIAAGGGVTFTATGTLDSGATGTVDNTAFIASTADTTPGNNSATDSDVIVPGVDLTITKTDGQNTAIPGTPITYTIVVGNSGPNPVTGASVNDTFPASISSVTWTCSATAGSSCASANGSGTIASNVNLLVGGAATFTASGTIASSTTGTLSNTASVAAPSGMADPDLSDNSATDSDTLTPQTDLRVTLTDSPDPIAVGNFLRYQIIVTNTGPSNATGVVITDVLPASVAFDSASGSCVEVSGTVTCDLTSIARNGMKTINIFVIPSTPGLITNTVSVAGAEFDPASANNSANTITLVTTNADLSISKTDGQTTATPGGTVTYTIIVTNSGAVAVTGAVISDTQPAALTSMTWSCVASGGSACGAANGSGTINTGVNLAPGGSATFTVIGAISAGATGTLVNTASVTAPVGVTDPTPGNNSATDSDTLTPVSVNADLRISKTDGMTTTLSGTTITYTIVVTNAGPGAVTGATLIDSVPLSVTNVSWSCVASAGSTCGAGGSGNIISTTLNLLNGGVATYTVTGVVAPTAQGVLTNTATITVPAGVTDPTPSNNVATDTTLIVLIPPTGGYSVYLPIIRR